LIARLDVKGSRLIKGIRFEGLRALGDPWEAALRYARDGADELLYIDAVASLYGRSNLIDLLRRTCQKVFIPITAGGGVRSVQDAAALLAAGADKIAVNTASLARPELITELAEAFGRQCVVASVQARRTMPGAWEAMGEAGRERTGRDVLEWIELLQQLGAGELLLTSVDQDGTCAGPDLPLLEAAASRSRVPLVFGGGFADTNQLLTAWQQPNVSGVSLGAALHYRRLDLSTAKNDLASSTLSLPLRVSPADESPTFLPPDHPSLAGCCIGVIDYGMGNQQSLINALETLGADVLLSDQPERLHVCDLLALPGVGAFPKGMAALSSRSLDTWLREEWVAAGQPLLGICLGMQMLFEASEEFGVCNGLGLLQGRVRPLPSQDVDGGELILPHMGWNRLLLGSGNPKSKRFEFCNQYFVHSYAACDVDPSDVIFHCRYGRHTFVAAVRRGSIAGFQFHPERSGPEGLELLAAVCCEILSAKRPAS
jgi:imidazole glycerol phosphate synthase glutamine amidotransferase subunit